MRTLNAKSASLPTGCAALLLKLDPPRTCTPADSSGFLVRPGSDSMGVSFDAEAG
jgi:hypothetical protein